MKNKKSKLDTMEENSSKKQHIGKNNNCRNTEKQSQHINSASLSTDYLESHGLDLSFVTVLNEMALLKWNIIKQENLSILYVLLFKKDIADTLFKVFESDLQYFSGDLAKIRVFGKWHPLPRQQVSYGDHGLVYKYSGITTPALPWPKPLEKIVNTLSLIRYRDGHDKIGEHRDDEKELDPCAPIASLTFGQERLFYFRHKDSKPPLKCPIEKVQINLEHGSLLLMNPPTNKYWYHALPPCKSATGVRINLTFRKIKA